MLYKLDDDEQYSELINFASEKAGKLNNHSIVVISQS